MNYENILLQLKIQHPVIIILIIFFSSIFLIFFTRLFFNLVLFFLFRKYLKLHQKVTTKIKKQYHKKKNWQPKEDDQLFRQKDQQNIEFPRAHSEIKAEIKKKRQENSDYEIMTNLEEQQQHQELNSVEIVDFVRPIGYWTSFVLGKKLTYLIQSAQILNKRGDKGFWASMIEAQERLNHRQKSRGR